LTFTTPITSSNQASAALFSLSLIDGRVQKLVELPPDTREALWAPDGSGALILGVQLPYTFFSFNDASLVDLQAIIATGARNFVWLPPAQRR
jgi:hypothetical protein